MLGRVAGAAGAVWARVAPGQDAAGRVRALRDQAPEGARGREAGDIRFSRLYAHLRKDAEERVVCRAPSVDSEAPTGQAAAGEGATAASAARSTGASGTVASAGSAGMEQLPRGAGQLDALATISVASHLAMVSRASATRFATSADVGAVLPTDRGMVSPSQDPSSLAVGAVCRHSSKVRAVCGNSARTDPCGGRSVMGVPTATKTITAGDDRVDRSAGGEIGAHASQQTPPAQQDHCVDLRLLPLQDRF